MIISLAQINVVLGDQEKNYAKVCNWVAEGAKRGSDIVLFPELWSTGYDLENCEKHAFEMGQGLFQRVSQLAKKHNVYVGGSLLEKHDNHIYNTLVIYNNSGDLVELYRKVHLFRLMDEHNWLCAGDRLANLSVGTIVCGLSICYDLRFPEVFSKYAEKGTHLIFLVAEWPEKRISHWKTLTKARAIENQYFVAAVNRVGISKGEKFGGNSVIVNPWGDVVIEGGKEEELLTAEINLDDVKAVRRLIPILKDRRNDIF